jgi:hypothetical protein
MGLVSPSCVVRAVAGVLAASVALAVPVSIAWASSGPAVTAVSVLPSRVLTDTGVVVRAGDLVEIRAAGRIHFGRPPIDRMAPAGIPWGQSCNVVAESVVGWPARGLACWSLIGRVGSAPPFEIGDARTLRITGGGELFLGVNDNLLGDNSGAWSVTVRVTPRTVVTVPPTPATTPPPDTTGSKHSSSSTSVVVVVTVLAAVVALVALAALVALLALRRRAAARRADAGRFASELAATEPVAAEVAAALSGDILPEPRRHSGAGVVETSVEGDPSDVNIFEVEFPDVASLRVGYSYFPEGTVLRWRLRQDGTTTATGEFVTSGGGSTNHFVTIALGVELETNSDGSEGADIDFTWSIGGVPFGYSVRRGLRN